MIITDLSVGSALLLNKRVRYTLGTALDEYISCISSDNVLYVAVKCNIVLCVCVEADDFCVWLITVNIVDNLIGVFVESLLLGLRIEYNMFGIELERLL